MTPSTSPQEIGTMHPLKAAITEGECPAQKRAADYITGDKFRKRGKKVTKPNRNVIPTEYEHSAADDIVLQDIEDSGHKPLHNASPPEHRIQQETPRHRALALLFAQGKTVKEIFLQLGGTWDNELGRPVPSKHSPQKATYSYAHLTQIRRQPWFQRLVVEYLEEEGRDQITALLESQATPSIERVIAIRDDKDAPAASQLAAANSLLDRFLGRATQRVESTSVKEVHNYEHDAVKIEEEIKLLNEQLAHHTPEPLRDVTPEAIAKITNNQ